MKLIKQDNLDLQLKRLSEDESAQMWQAVRQQMQTRESVHRSFWASLAGKPAYVLGVLAMFLFAGSSGTVVLAQQSFPGDALYPVARAYESLQLAVAVDPEKKAKLSLKFSQKRLQEVKKVLSQNNVSLEAVQSLPALNTVDLPAVATITPATEVLPEASQRSPIKNLEKNHKALIKALDYLEKAQDSLKKSGDQEQLEEVNSLVDQLTEHTENYVNNLEKIKQSLPDTQKQRHQIDRSEKELKIKFKLDELRKRNNDDRNDDSEEDNNREGQDNDDDRDETQDRSQSDEDSEDEEDARD